MRLYALWKERGFKVRLSRSPQHTAKSISAAAISLFVAIAIPATAAADAEAGYTKVNLASNLPGVAQTTDANLVNTWGLARGFTGPWWIANNNAGSASVYSGSGTQVAPTIAMPAPTGSSGGTPTGDVVNRLAFMPSLFRIAANGNTGPSNVMFATEDGTILGWNQQVSGAHAVIAVDRSSATDTLGDKGAVYKGLAMGFSHFQPYLYATNFRFGTIEMFDSNFKLVRSFTDPALSNLCPASNQCYAPFGIQSIRNKLYVSFALQQAGKHDDQAGAGNGFVDVFSTDGMLQKRLAAHGTLNSPWGLAVAPYDFGKFSNDLLVGNFGDGTINAYNPENGTFMGALEDRQGKRLAVDGLWALAFGNGSQAGGRNELFFTAGLNGESDGLFGKITENE